MQDEARQAVRLQDYRAPDYRTRSVDLCFELAPEATRVVARLDLRSEHDRRAGVRPLKLDGEDLKLLAIALDGRPLPAEAYAVDERQLTLHQPPEQFTLELVTEIQPSANTRLEGLYVSGGTFCTQCEAEGFRRITYFQDRPDVMATYRTTIRADRAACPVLLSNGNRISGRDLGDGRHEAVWEDPFPKPSYLFALVAGDLGCLSDSFTTASGRQVRLNIYVEHGNEPRAGYAMAALKRAMRWDEQTFGLEYDLDVFNIVAVSDFNMGAMENKSLNLFNAKYVLADAETATDQDYAFIEAIVAHEYFHNWTGNRVTCRDWFQLSLKEGLTVYRDQEFSADMRSRGVKRIKDVRQLRARQFPEDAGPLAHPVRPSSYLEINNFYTATVYDKGAEVIRMIAKLIGREKFREGMALYIRRHDGTAATCDDFVAAMQDASGIDLSQFKLWYSEAGTPVVTAVGRHDPETRSYGLTLTQSRRAIGEAGEPPALHLPLEIGLIGPDGCDLPLRLDGEPAGSVSDSRVIELKDNRLSLRFHGIAAPPVASVNRGFTAPIILAGEVDEAAEAFRMAHDSDPFNRWESGQRFGTALLLRMVGALQRQERPEADEAFVAALGRTLADDRLEPAFRAEMLALPSEDYLAEQLTPIDVEAIHHARKTLRQAIGRRLKESLRRSYEALADSGPYSPDAAAAGRRALRNAALGYLAALEEPEPTALVRRQYETADNMTERLAALGLLSETAGPDRDAALADFHDRFQTDPLVLDKWFSLQAMSPLPDTLDRVRALMAHPAFSIRNPNKVRALIGAFAASNPLRFHAADGSGYQFIADQVLALDAMNPQVAARLAASFGRWRRFDTGRQALMRQALERILAAPNLSTDVYEIASKSLR